MDDSPARPPKPLHLERCFEPNRLEKQLMISAYEAVIPTVTVRRTQAKADRSRVRPAKSKVQHRNHTRHAKGA